MDTLKNVFAGMIILIGLYLVVANYQGTTQVVSALGGQATSLTATLQGRGSAGGGTNGVNFNNPNGANFMSV